MNASNLLAVMAPLMAYNRREMPAIVLTSNMRLTSGFREIATPAGVFNEHLKATHLISKSRSVVNSDPASALGEAQVTLSSTSNVFADIVNAIMFTVSAPQQKQISQFDLNVTGALLDGTAYNQTFRIGSVVGDETGRVRGTGIIFPSFAGPDGRQQFLPLRMHGIISSDIAAQTIVVTANNSLEEGVNLEAEAVMRGSDIQDVLLAAALLAP